MHSEDQCGRINIKGRSLVGNERDNENSMQVGRHNKADDPRCSPTRPDCCNAQRLAPGQNDQTAINLNSGIKNSSRKGGWQLSAKRNLA
ncbi:hypothetical protein J6590_010572 [Homalodisca vitripennis]|nr:hypothetical protein J6590_010572 [Homalodisca vitripennis]